ncbi:MAG: hypothetical protein ACE5G9_11110 [Nitrospinales bacterium]
MKTIAHYLTLCVFLLVSGPALGSPKAEINLWKRDPFLYGPCGHCADFINLRENENCNDFSQFNLYQQSGDYQLDLFGPKGTTITLFGMRDFDITGGFIVITKKDDSPVEIADLEGFSPETWVDVKKKGRKGAYTAYYQSHRNFKSNVASVGWGQWWPRGLLAVKGIDRKMQFLKKIFTEEIKVK